MTAARRQRIKWCDSIHRRPARYAATRGPQCHPERQRQTPLDRMPTRDLLSTRGAMRRFATTPRSFAHTPTNCCCERGSAETSRRRRRDPGRRRPDGTYDAWPRAACRLSRRARPRKDGQVGRTPRRSRIDRRADMGRRTPAGPLAHVARARRGDGDGGRARHRHGRRPPLASHRLPGRLPEARDRSRRDGAHPLQRSVGPQRRAVRRRHVRVHAEPARRRHPDVRRSDPARRIGELHDQRADDTATPGRRIARAPMGAGCARQSHARSGRAVQRTERHAVAARRARSRSQGVRAAHCSSRR